MLTFQRVSAVSDSVQFVEPGITGVPSIAVRTGIEERRMCEGFVPESATGYWESL